MLELYTQHTSNPNDRRKQNSSVPFERRSGLDRRANQRIDASIKEDIIKTQSELKNIKEQGDFFVKQVNKYDSFVKPPKKNQDSQTGFAAASLAIIPFYRRFTGIEDAIQGRETIKAITKGIITLINAPEDTKDLIKVKNQVKSKLKKEAPDIPHDYQTKFKFFRGTLFEPLLKKMVNSDNEKILKIGNKFYSADISLSETQLGLKIRNLLKVEFIDIKETSGKNIFDKSIKAYKLEGKPLAKLIYRAMMRIPVISLGIVSILEIPSVINAFGKGANTEEKLKNGVKQTAKSSISTILITASTAIIGGLFASRKGLVGSLVGIGLGSFIGAKASQTINNQFDVNNLV